MNHNKKISVSSVFDGSHSLNFAAGILLFGIAFLAAFSKVVLDISGSNLHILLMMVSAGVSLIIGLTRNGKTYLYVNLLLGSIFFLSCVSMILLHSFEIAFWFYPSATIFDIGVDAFFCGVFFFNAFNYLRRVDF